MTYTNDQDQNQLDQSLPSPQTLTVSDSQKAPVGVDLPRRTSPVRITITPTLSAYHSSPSARGQVILDKRREKKEKNVRTVLLRSRFQAKKEVKILLPQGYS
jgi:hypothetical protein